MLRRWYGLVIAISLVLLGAVLWLFHRSRGRAADASDQLVAMAEAWHGRAIAVGNADLTVLSSDTKVNAEKIEALRARVAKHSDALKLTYKEAGMKPNEIVARFRRISR